MASEYHGLLVDWGGVMTSDRLESFGAFGQAAAVELGRATIHHTESHQTVAQLESLLGLRLR